MNRRARSVLPGPPLAGGLALTAGGLALAAGGLALPPGHTASMLTGSDPATPVLVLGLWLFKGVCVVNGVLLCAMGWTSRVSGFGPAEVAEAGPFPASGASGSRPGGVAAFGVPGGLPRRDAVLLSGVLLAALSFRLVHLSDGLWFDEILTLRNYVSLPLGRIFTTFDSQNQHLLYSIAARVTTVLFGPGAAPLRLPAVLFGVGSVWALFWFGTLVTSRREALLAAMLMAVSYHHVWFSQDARGYTGLLLWTLLGSGLFLRIVRSGAWTGWKLPAAYGIVMALALYTHMTAAVILAAHAAIALAAALTRRSSLVPAGAGLGLAAAFSLQLYAPVLPQMLNTLLTPTMSGVSIEWRNPFWLLRESLTVLGRGVPGGWVSLVAGVLVVGIGARSYLRRDWIDVAVMLAPAAILGALVVGLAQTLLFLGGFWHSDSDAGFFRPVSRRRAAPRDRGGQRGRAGCGRGERDHGAWSVGTQAGLRVGGPFRGDRAESGGRGGDGGHERSALRGSSPGWLDRGGQRRGAPERGGCPRPNVAPLHVPQPSGRGSPGRVGSCAGSISQGRRVRRNREPGDGRGDGEGVTAVGDRTGMVRERAPVDVEVVGGQPGAELKREVSVVIPAFNEAAHVADEVRAVRETLERTGWRYEVIVVDDGSGDGTARAAAATGVRVLRHARNMGYGAALKRGIEAARYGWILITDADGTYPADSISSLLDAAPENDMVVGARIGRRVKVPLIRRPAKWLLRRLASYLAGQRLPDLNSGLRLMRRSLVQRYVTLLPSGFSFTTTITLAAACNGHPVQYVPIDYRARLGDSKIRAWHAYEFTLLILRTIVFFNPLKVFIPVGGVLALAGTAKFIYDITLDNLSESAVLAYLAALIIWMVGLLADQNARIAMNR
ncbi:MAG: glycosyltransferase [Gemmatimonadota bacterium]